MQTTVGLVFESHGATLMLQSNKAEILDAMLKRLPPKSNLIESGESAECFGLFLSDQCVAEPSVYGLFHNGSLVVQTDSLALALDEIESQLHAAVALGSTAGLFVHAGVVGWKGGAIVIPGRSMSGKTSLVAALVKAGADYYSDEYAVFDQQGYVHPYHKPLNIRIDQAGQRHKCRVEEFGGRIGTESLPLALIIATQYEPQAEWKPQPLTTGQAVLKLFDNTIDALGQLIYAINTYALATAKCLAIVGVRPATEQIVPSIIVKLSAKLQT